MLVKQTDETIKDFNPHRIFSSLKEETNLSDEESQHITDCVALYLNSFKLKAVESGFIRVLAYQIMLEQGHSGRKMGQYAPIYIPLSELNAIDTLSSELTNDNANIGNSPESIHKKKADFVSKQQNLRMFPEYIESAHRSGDIHIHDLEYFRTRNFCIDTDLRHAFYHGVSIDGSGNTSAICGPAKHASVAILHAIKIFGAGQVNSAGGQGFFNFLTFLSPYFKDLTYEEIKQQFQMFIYEANTMLVARGGQAVFSSVQLTPAVPKLWWDKPVVWKGEIDKELTYGDLNETVNLMFQAFMEVLIKGDNLGRPFSFPKPEVNIKKEYLDQPKCMELYKLAVELSIKYGSTYYDNEYTPKRRVQEGITCMQCCAYAFKVDPKKDPFFNDKMYFKDYVGFSMGGSQVITINLPRLAWKSHNYEELKEKTIRLIEDVIMHIFKIKDEVRKEMHLPFFDWPDKEHGIFNTNDLVYIIGFVGANEVCEILEGVPITKSNEIEEYIQWLNEYVETLSFNEQMEGKSKVALSRTPAETTCMRFATLDKAKYEEKIEPYLKGDLDSGAIYYTNGCMIPPEYEEDLVQKIEIEGKFFKHVSGGNIFHLFLGEESPDVDGLYELVMNICTNSNIDYFAVSRDLTICKSCKQIVYQIEEKCPHCSSEDIIRLARITGYIQTIDMWNDGKIEELKQRKRY